MPPISGNGETGTSMLWNDLARERIAVVTGADLSQRVASTTRHHSIRAQAELDRDIDDAVRAISTLRMARNSLTLISMLPVDILPLIFQFCTFGSPVFPSGAPSWLVVTWVCGLWRDVALHTPSLWACIPFHTGEQLVEVFLERAKSVPLIVHVPAAETLGPNPAFVKNVQLISSHIKHIEELSMHASIHMYNAVLQELRVPAPMLKCGDLKLMDLYDTNCLDLPSDSFISRAPLLQELSLTNIMVPWNSISWSTLRSLCISHHTTPETSTLRGSSLDLLQGLTRATRLEELALHHCLPSFTHIDTSKSFPAIPLRHLKKLALSGPHEESFQLYELLDFPPSARVHIALCFQRICGPDNRKLVSLIRTHCSSSAGDQYPVQMLDIISSGTYLSIRVWRSLAADLCDKPVESSRHIHAPFSAIVHTAPAFSLELFDMIAAEGTSRSERDLIAELCRAVPLEDMCRLSLNIFRRGPAWGKAVWLDIFGNAKNICFVRLHGDAAHSFMAALVTVPDDGTTPRSKARGAATRKFKHAPRNDLFLPQLRSIYLEDVYLDGDFSGQPFHVRLASYLRLRAERAPIEGLYITDCTLHDEMLEGLENIRRLNVVWDGSYGEYESDEEDYMESDDYLSDFL